MKNNIISFIWQHLLLLVSLYVMTLGVAVCVRSQLGSVGTLFAMVYVGIVVRTVNKHFGWFDCILAYKPGFRRYVYGLSKHVKHLYGN